MRCFRFRDEVPPLGHVEINVCPLRLPQFSGPDEHQRCQTQRAGNNQRSLIAVEGIVRLRVQVAQWTDEQPDTELSRLLIPV